MSVPVNSRKCFEDFDEGYVFESRVAGLTETEITRFAAMYDPQCFHLDHDEAAKTHFGGLVASGFQTQLHCFRPFCEQVLRATWAVGAPGIDSLKWLRPWFPGEALDIKVTLARKRPSSSRKDRGYLSLEMRAEANGAPVLAMDWMVIVLTREGVKKFQEN